jgi:hypothetical protein
MKKLTLIIVSIFSFSVLSFSQKTEFENFLLKPKFDYSLELGSGFIKSNSFSGFYNYLSPSINYSVQNKFVVNAGFMLINSPNFGISNTENTGNSFSSFVFVGAEYLLTDKFSVNGKILYPTNTFINMNKENNMNIIPKIYSFGAKYKFNENFSFGIQVTNSSNNLYPIYNGVNE